MSVCLACKRPWDGKGLRCPRCRVGAVDPLKWERPRPRLGPAPSFDAFARVVLHQAATALQAPDPALGTICLSVPLPPDFSNARRHWRATLRAKKAYWAKLDELRAARLLPAPPERPVCPATIAATLYVWNRLDDSNAMARMKWLEDWLVGSGYLAGDDRSRLRWAGLPEQVIDRRHPRVEITITPTN